MSAKYLNTSFESSDNDSSYLKSELEDNFRWCLTHVPKLPGTIDVYTDNYGDKDVAARYVKETNHSDAYRKSTYLLLRLIEKMSLDNSCLSTQGNSLVTQRIDEILSCDNSNVCLWAQNEDGLWLTDCGEIHEFTVGTPKENKYSHCPYCGRLLKEV